MTATRECSSAHARVWLAPMILVMFCAWAPASARAAYWGVGAKASAVGAKSGKSRQIDTIVVVLDGQGKVISPEVPQLQYGVERALRGQRRLAVRDVDARLARQARQLPNERLSEARGLLRSGEALLRKGSPRPALNRLRPALAHLQELLSHGEKRKFARAQFLAGAAHAMLGNKRSARRLFIKLQIWRPSFRVITRFAPDKVLPLWDAAAKRVKKLRGGSVELSSSPSALTYVDGSLLGASPTTAEALTVGTHYVTFKLPGYQRVVAPIKVSARRQRKLRRTLKRSPGLAKLRALVAKVAGGLGRSTGPGAVRKIGDLLGVEHAVFLIRSEEDKTRFQAYVYDTKTRKRLAAVQATLPGKASRASLKSFATALYATVKFERTIKVARKPKPKKKRATRSGPSIFGRWWFWTAIATAVAVPIVLTNLPESGPSCPSGFMCGRLRLSF